MIVADHELDSLDQAVSQFGEQSLPATQGFPRLATSDYQDVAWPPSTIPTAISGVWLPTAHDGGPPRRKHHHQIRIAAVQAPAYEPF